MNARRAIVTVLLGNRFQFLWQRHCRANWEKYALRHSADLIVFDRYLDTSPRALNRRPSWQKLLVLGQPELRDHEQVVWLDADVLIHPHAGWIGENVPATLVGAGDEYEYPTPEIHYRALKQLYRLWKNNHVRYADNATPRDFYRVGGFDREFDRAVQAGILVLSPHHHREILEHVYHTYDQAPLPGLAAEMRPLSYELLKAEMVHWLAPNWHAIWLIEKQLRYPFLFTEPRHPLLSQCATRALAENYFLHFAGVGPEVEFVNWDSPLLAQPPAPRVYPNPVTTALPCESPVALILFNRPDTTAQVMQAIRNAQPRHLYLIADGPRDGNPTDGEHCAQARKLALQVDWDCQVDTNFADENMGLKARVESGLNWLFEKVDRAIILEDDCAPDPSFFPYCDQLLERYADDERIFAIAGSDHKFGLTDDTNSYTFSRYPLIWGWATWRRAWQLNDPAMSSLPHAIAAHRLGNLLGNLRAAQYWEFVLSDAKTTGTTWDYPFLWTMWEHGGLCIHPNVNLVENVGFGADATHTLGEDSPFSNVLPEAMPFPLKHPTGVARDEKADALVEEIAFSGAIRRLWERVRAARIAHKQTVPRAA